MEQTENKLENSVANEGKNIAVIAYLTIIGLIIAFVMNNEKKNEFAAFHIRQSLGVALAGLALGLISMIPVLGWIVFLVGIFVLLYMWVMGLLNAVNSKEKTVPLLGDQFAEWFKNL